MDFLSSCYYSSMRPYRDRPDIVVRGRWRWCPEGAVTIPFFHAFGSFLQIPELERRENPVGELPQRNGLSRGQSNPRYTGQGWCGTREDWEQGALYSARVPPPVDNEGIPLCCPTMPLNPGGIEVAGDADQGAPMRGGAEVGGAGSSPFAKVLVADGGAEVGGAGLVPLVRSVTMDGGTEVDGVWPIVLPPDAPTISDVEVGGEGSRPVYRLVEMTGGVEAGGEGSNPVTLRAPMTGGVEVGESGLVPVDLVQLAVGGVEVGESGLVPLATQLHGSGGVEVGGDARTPLRTDRHAAGGVEVGSSAAAGGAVLIGACHTPISRVLFVRPTFIGGGGDCPCAYVLLPVRIEYSDVLGAWVGFQLFGTCGGSWSWQLQWVGPTALDWSVTVRWSGGSVVVVTDPVPFLNCSPFELTTPTFGTDSIPIGCGEPGTAFFEASIDDLG